MFEQGQFLGPFRVLWGTFCSIYRVYHTWPHYEVISVHRLALLLTGTSNVWARRIFRVHLTVPRVHMQQLHPGRYPFLHVSGYLQYAPILGCVNIALRPINSFMAISGRMMMMGFETGSSELRVQCSTNWATAPPLPILGYWYLVRLSSRLWASGLVSYCQRADSRESNLSTPSRSRQVITDI